jgi:hypothetical protein
MEAGPSKEHVNNHLPITPLNLLSNTLVLYQTVPYLPVPSSLPWVQLPSLSNLVYMEPTVSLGILT